LFDEPVAAFLAYLAEVVSGDSDVLPGTGQTKNLVVFDFGGGTCDVAVFCLGRQNDGALTITPLNVSRYHRLGGGDIDRAIIHEILLPQLLEQNGLDRHSLNFEQKRHYVQPALLGVAEALKQKLCIEIVRLRKLGLWDKTDKTTLAQTLPGSYPIQLKDRTLTIESPKLTVGQFEEVLKPFLERDLLRPQEDEYRVSCSIFAPLQDGILRSGLDSSRIGFTAFLDRWLDDYASHRCTPKTLERYRQLGQHAKTYLGDTQLQSIAPLAIESMLNTLLDSGGRKDKGHPDGRPLSARTARHVAFLIHDSLESAVRWGILPAIQWIAWFCQKLRRKKSARRINRS
jgi:hypothetical protein